MAALKGDMEAVTGSKMEENRFPRVGRGNSFNKSRSLLNWVGVVDETLDFFLIFLLGLLRRSWSDLSWSLMS